MKNPETKKRPFGLYMIVILQLLIALFLGLSLAGIEQIDLYLKVLVQNPLFYTWVGWVLVGTLLLAIFGLLRLKRWGWTLTMILTGVGLSFSIWNYFQGTSNFLTMLIWVVMVFYLNQKDVQAAFQHRGVSEGSI